MANETEILERRQASIDRAKRSSDAIPVSPDMVSERGDIRAKRPYLVKLLLRMDFLRRISRVLTLIVLDFFGLFFAIYVALLIKAEVVYPGSPHMGLIYGETKKLIPFVFLVTLLLFARNGLYSVRELRPGLSRVVSSLTLVMVVSLVFAEVNGMDFSSYYIFYGSVFFGVVFVSTLRWGYEKTTGAIWKAAGYTRNAILVGSGEQIEAVAKVLADNKPITYGRLEYIAKEGEYVIEGLHNLGSLDALRARLDENQIDEVIITDPDFPHQEAVALVDECHRRGIEVRVAPTTMEMLTQRAEFVPGQNLPLFAVRPPVFEGVDFIVKRTFDIIMASLFLILLSPLLLLTALAIKLSSRGPVLYKSKRRGIGLQPFNCLKFRTMHSNAEEKQSELEHLNEADGALFKMRSDPRLTKVGKLIRRYSLDELPQLLNVIRGQMSLVGPRPLPERDYKRLEGWHKKRYLVLPGVTGLWQVSGRSDLNFDEMVRLDFLYIEQWSVFLDLAILVKTVPAVVTRRGAF